MDSFKSVRALLATCPSDAVQPTAASPAATSRLLVGSSSALLSALNTAAALNAAAAVAAASVVSPTSATTTTTTTNSPPKPVKNLKAKKRAAFEEWHRRKFEQISGGGDATTDGADDDNEVSSTTHEVLPTTQKRAKMAGASEAGGNAGGGGIGAWSPTTLSDQLILSLMQRRDNGDSPTPSPSPLLSQLTRKLSSASSNGGDQPSATGGCNGGGGGGGSSVGQAKDLTAPKLSRHNDAAYYPNIQCILCKEWVCSRNRYMHIESHLQYRPYKCSVCGYDNRKEIFINLHIKRTHGNNAKVVYKPDPELEHRAWLMAEQCLQHTRDILTKNEEEACADTTSVKPKMDATLLARYANQFRPRIFNSQRAEKSQLIEESRQMGLVPDFSEVASRETQCAVCEAHVLSHQAVLEEHVRTHLSLPSYRCTIDGCITEHHSKNFLTRHMKEVHKYRRAPLDLLELNGTLMADYVQMAARSFPEHFATATAGKRRAATRSVDEPLLSTGDGPLAQLLLAPQLSAPAVLQKSSPFTASEVRRKCNLCQTSFPDDYATIYSHVKIHLSVVPYQCRECHFGDVVKSTVLAHIEKVHGGDSSALENMMTAAVAQQCHLLLAACFPDVILQPWLHDEITVKCESQ